MTDERDPDRIEDMRIERDCVRCGYRIHPGFFHQEQTQPPGSNVVVCSLRRANGMILRGKETA